MVTDRRVTLQDCLSVQRAEALSDDNRWFAGEFFGREATDAECIIYYCEHGGAEGFRIRQTTRLQCTAVVTSSPTMPDQ